MDWIPLASTEPKNFGQDHFSLLAYIETCCVDHGGKVDGRRMRCNSSIHWKYDCNRIQWRESFSTRLKGYGRAEGEAKTNLQLLDHDDWDAAEDLAAAGWITQKGRGPKHSIFTLTPVGEKIAAQLRAYKARGGNYANFEPDLLAAA